MDTTAVREWYQGRLDIADAIVETFSDAGLFDAEILLCCAMSALASRIWPREKDKFRYVQLLVDSAPCPAEVKRISIPKLHEVVLATGDIASAQVLESRFLAGLEGRVLTGTEIDQSEETLTALFSSMPLRYLRRASYAAIIYIDLRCGLVHEYNLSPHMINFGWSIVQDVPSYVNVMTAPEADCKARLVFLRSHSKRRLYLPYPYVRKLITDIAQAVFDHWDEASEWCRPRPQSWWFKGEAPE